MILHGWFIAVDQNTYWHKFELIYMFNEFQEKLFDPIDASNLPRCLNLEFGSIT